jgi:hypothetical protein
MYAHTLNLRIESDTMGIGAICYPSGLMINDPESALDVLLLYSLND